MFVPPLLISPQVNQIIYIRENNKKLILYRSVVIIRALSYKSSLILTYKRTLDSLNEGLPIKKMARNRFQRK